MNVKVGTCSKCGDEGVRITYRASIPSQCMCMGCDIIRRRERNKACQSIQRARKRAKDRVKEPAKAKASPMKRSPIQRVPIAKKKTKRLVAKRTADDVLNKSLWWRRKHACYECLKPLEFPGPPPKWVFSHVHGKGARPDLRYVRENVVFHCSDCHREWEAGGKRSEKMPRTLQLFERISVKYPDNINRRQ